MPVKEYNFTEFTNKEMFEMRLKGDTPDFGYISIKNRLPFLNFLVKHNFMEDKGAVSSRLKTHKDNKTLVRRYEHFRNQYKVLESFKYSQMDGYNPKPNKIYVGQDVFTTQGWKMFAMQL